jgi:hypothetical protein
MATKHTPGPYHLSAPTRISANATHHGMHGAMQVHVADADSAADAQFIVTACNAHTDLLEALQTIALHAPSLDAQGIRDIADTAIAKAGVQSS